MWFVDAPAPTTTFGDQTGPHIQLVAVPDNSAQIWAIIGQPLVWQQVDYPQEFEVMPDSLLQSAAYWLEQAGATLPAILRSAVGGGPELLNARSHPMVPSLMRVAGANVLAMCRSFAALQMHTTLLTDHWLGALCPRGTKLTLV
jgi:hypothetical protein